MFKNNFINHDNIILEAIIRKKDKSPILDIIKRNDNILIDIIIRKK